MKSADIIKPTPLIAPIANDGLKNTIPDDATGSNYASIAEGFPEMTMKAPKDGGLPPWGQDFNGMFYLMSSQTCFLQNGGLITFDEDVSNKIGGYPQDAILDYITPGNSYVKVKSLIDDNTYNFVTEPSYIDGEHWEEITIAATTSWGDITGTITNQTDLIDYIYPVGSIYMSVNTTSPSVLFGGVWEQIQGRFLLASDTNNPVGTTGGEATHTLTTAEMPSHTHSGSSVSAGAHTHTRGSMEFGGYFGLSGLDTYGGNYGNGVFSISAMSTGPANGHATNQANGFTNFQILGSRNWTGSTSSNGAHTHTINIGSTGSGSAHNSMPPYLAVNIWKRTA